MMNDRCNYGNPVRLHHLANKYCLKKEGPTQGVSQTGSHNQRNPTFEERSVSVIINELLKLELLIRLKKQQYMSVIWTCLFKFNDRKNHPRYSRWVNCAKKLVTRMNGIQVSHHTSSRMEERSSVKPTSPFPWCPQACNQPNTRHKLWMTGSRHELWATVNCKLIRNYQNGFNDSRKDKQGDRQVRQTSLQLTWTYHRQSFLLPRSKIYFKQSRRTVQFIHSFSEGPEVRTMQTHESHESTMQNKSLRSGG